MGAESKTSCLAETSLAVSRSLACWAASSEAIAIRTYVTSDKGKIQFEIPQ
jgi:hypothetical protein